MEERYDDEKAEESRELDSFNNYVASRETKLINKIKDANTSS